MYVAIRIPLVHAHALKRPGSKSLSPRQHGYYVNGSDRSVNYNVPYDYEYYQSMSSQVQKWQTTSCTLLSCEGWRIDNLNEVSPTYALLTSHEPIPGGSPLAIGGTYPLPARRSRVRCARTALTCRRRRSY